MQRLALQHACLYAKVFAAHIWQALFAREPLSRAAGEKLRRCMLARGGARALADMLRDGLGGEEPSAEAFLRDTEQVIEQEPLGFRGRCRRASGAANCPRCPGCDSMVRASASASARQL